MGIITLYHGTPNKLVVPQYGGGDEKHDYGKGFYLTESIELAKEWAVCRPNNTNGWVHKYELDTDGLRILDFQQRDVLAWLAELMKHREAADSKRYRMLAEKFIEKYGIDTGDYDVIRGWRANASYFYIAKEFVRDNIDIDILEELLSLGGLGLQYCIKSKAAYANLREKSDELLVVPYAEFNDRYNQRDVSARNNMRELVDSDANKVTKVFSTLAMSKTRGKNRELVGGGKTQQIWQQSRQQKQTQLCGCAVICRNCEVKWLCAKLLCRDKSDCCGKEPQRAQRIAPECGPAY